MRWLFALPLATGFQLNPTAPLWVGSGHTQPLQPDPLTVLALRPDPRAGAPVHRAGRAGSAVVMSGGKGFGGGEATRDPEPTVVDASDPKGKQQAIHKAESFADYLARRQAGGSGHSAAPPPPAAEAVDYAAVRAELLAMMDNPSWDDGSLAPLFIRLAWHSSGTYDQASGTGGSNGAGMRFATEAADPENAGLEVARAFLEPVKRRFPAISYSDLWVLAAYVGIEHTDGPVIPFTPGRSDHQDEGYWAGMSYGRLPAAEKYLSDDTDSQGRVKGWEGLSGHVRNEVFGRMGFDDQEIVALLCGGHVYGRCHPKASGYAGPWVEHPTRFSNEYATDMIEDEWRLVDHSDTWLDAQGAAELRPAPGKRQYVNKRPDGGDDGQPNQMMLVSDMILAWDADFRKHLERYAADEGELKRDFGQVFKKLTELGCGFA